MKKRISPELFWERVLQIWQRVPYVPPNFPPYPQELIDAIPENQRVNFVREGSTPF